MKQYKLIYVFDVLCPWCYAFSDTVLELYEEYRGKLEFEIICGGMIQGKQADSIEVDSPEEFRASYDRITQRSGVQFGEPFLQKAEEGQTVFNSEPSAIALAVFKSYDDERALLFAHQMQKAIFRDGGDPTDKDLFAYLAGGFGINEEEFRRKMDEDQYLERARYDFALAKQIKAKSFPRLYLQTGETYFYLLAKGYGPPQPLKNKIDKVIEEWEKRDPRVQIDIPPFSSNGFSENGHLN